MSNFGKLRNLEDPLDENHQKPVDLLLLPEALVKTSHHHVCVCVSRVMHPTEAPTWVFNGPVRRLPRTQKLKKDSLGFGPKPGGLLISPKITRVVTG